MNMANRTGAPSEFVESIPDPRGPGLASFMLPTRFPNAAMKTFPRSPAGFNVTVSDGRITDCRLAFGGMAGTPKRAAKAEAALRGPALGARPAFLAAGQALQADFTPLSDWRASAEYRAIAARNLLQRFFLTHDDRSEAPADLLFA